MHVLGLKKTMKLWDRLERETGDYYRALHDAKNQNAGIGPKRFSDLPAAFSDLQRWHRRLKQRFIVMAIIGRPHVLPNISDLVQTGSVWVFGRGGIEAVMEEQKGSYNVQLR
jgi:hypothetical protein